MGVSKHPSGWLVRKMVADTMIQVLKPTEEEAEAEYSALVEIADLYRNEWATRINKRANAIAKDLPVGFVDTEQSYTTTKGNEVTYSLMKVTIKVDGKAKALSCTYGQDTTMKRTRDDALLILLKRLKNLGYKKAAI